MKKSLLILLLLGMVGCEELPKKQGEQKYGEDSAPIDIAKQPESLGDSPKDLSTLVLLTADVLDTFVMNENSNPQTPAPKLGTTLEADYVIDGYLVGKRCDLKKNGTCEHPEADAMYGVLARMKKEPNKYVIAIRGTVNKQDIKSDLNSTVTMSLDSSANSHVGKGFYNLYKQMKFVEPGKKRVDDAPPAHEILKEKIGTGNTVTVTGHSLGAVLAIYLTYDLASKDQLKVTGRYFASPKPGDKAFVDGFSALVQDHHVYNYKKSSSDKDIVSSLPANETTQLIANTNIFNGDILVHESISCRHHAVDYAAMFDPGRCSSTDKTLCGEAFWKQRLEENRSLPECLNFNLSASK